MKVCSKCKIEKAESEFRIRQCRWDKNKTCLNSHCKDCERLYNKAYFKERGAAITERRKEYFKQWWAKNPDKQKQYRANENKEQRREYAKEWVRLNREKKRASNKRWEQKHIEKFREIQKNNSRRKRKNLDDHYLRRVLRERGFDKEIINNSPELVEVQKIIIKTKRLCKTLENSEKA